MVWILGAIGLYFVIGLLMSGALIRSELRSGPGSVMHNKSYRMRYLFWGMLLWGPNLISVVADAWRGVDS